MSAELPTDFHLEIAHVLFMDIVGYSKLLIDEQGELLQRLNQIVRGTAQFRRAETEGELIRLPTGDGMALVFLHSPEAPVQCAVEISHALRDFPQIELRMGVHSGPVNQVADVNDRSNLAGAGINIAQRVMDCGDAGHILLSRRVAEDLGQYRQWQNRLHELGECEVKHGVRLSLVNLYTDEIGNPTLPEKFNQTAAAAPTSIAKSAGPKPALIGAALLALAIAAIGFWLFSHRAAPRPIGALAPGTASIAKSVPEKSIAVLPFENLSEDKGNAYFADGIQDEILTRLAKVADLKVISRTSTQRFRSKPENLPEIARQLGVAHILEGSAQRAADQVRVNVQLIKAAADAHLWAETYDRKLTDVFGVETEIATKIADTLQAKLTGAEHKTMAARPTENMEAHELYLKGRFFAAKRTGDDLKKAIDYYNQALSQDPNYARAYTGIADSYAILGGFSGVTTSENFANARAAAEKALAIDNDLAEAHTSLALVMASADLNLKGARREFERAIELNPNYAAAHYFLGFTVFGPLAEFDAAIAEIKRALELDPLSLITNGNLAYCYIFARRYPDAILAARKAIELDPTSPKGQDMLGLALELSGQVPEAIAQYEKSFQASGGDYHTLVFLSHLYGVKGEREKALQSFQRAKEIEQRRGEEWAYGYAIIAIGLGDNEQAINWLERSYQVKGGPIYYIKVDPLFDPLRGNPRFEKLANQIVPKEAR